MKGGIIVAAIMFAFGLAIVVGNRLSNDAMAVVVGTVCGISASIPVSIGLVIASSSNWGKSERARDVGDPYGMYRYAERMPPVVIMSPQMPYGYAPNPYALPAPMPNPTIESREFKIIGGED